MNTFIKFFFIIFIACIPFKLYSSIPFQYYDGKMIIEVSINNNLHNFIFDTGSLTLISNNLKGNLGEKDINMDFEGIDANGVVSKMKLYSTNKINIGDILLKDLSFSFYETQWISKRACMTIDGVIGANALDGKIWKIDFKEKKIVFLEREKKIKKEIRTQLIEIPFKKDGFTKVPSLNGSIRGIDTEFTFDTGSGMGITIENNIYQKIKDEKYLVSEGLLSQGINSVSKGIRVIDLMKFTINNNDLGEQIVDSSTDATNLIGTRFMENFITTIDFINNKILLEPIKNDIRYESFGFMVAPSNGKIKIINVWETEETSLINLGDEITQINDLVTTELTTDIFCSILEIFRNKNQITIVKTNGEKLVMKKIDLVKKLN